MRLPSPRSAPRQGKNTPPFSMDLSQYCFLCYSDFSFLLSVSESLYLVPKIRWRSSLPECAFHRPAPLQDKVKTHHHFLWISLNIAFFAILTSVSCSAYPNPSI